MPRITFAYNRANLHGAKPKEDSCFFAGGARFGGVSALVGGELHAPGHQPGGAVHAVQTVISC